MAVTVKWNGDLAEQEMRAAVERGLQAVVLTFNRQCQMTVSEPNTGVTKVRTRNTRRGAKGSSYTVYPNSSRPGQPPKLRTGLGRRSITHRRIDWNHYQAGVQSLGAHMSLHEQRNRVWMARTLEANQAALGQVFAQYSGGGG